MIKFIHTADIHLSRPFGFLPPQLAEERRRDQREAVRRIARLVVDRQADLLLVAGDLFDSPDPDPSDLEVVVSEFTTLGESNKKIFIIPGNHDYVRPGSFWKRLNIPNLHVFLDTEWSTVTLNDLGVEVAGIAFQRDKSARRAFEGLEVAGNLPVIAMVHASLESFEGQMEKYHPFSEAELASVPAAYIALGHYHRFNDMTGGREGFHACYPGSPEGISFNSPETEERFVIGGEITDDGTTQIERVKINGRTMRSTRVDCTSFESESSLFDSIRQLCDRNAFVQLKPAGTPNSRVRESLGEIPERFRDSCAYLTIDESELLAPIDIPCDDTTIRGRFCKQLKWEIENASDPEKRRLFSRALELGLAAFAPPED
jgi:DNA repair exonuclease SbcCD nuclease subunit